MKIETVSLPGFAALTWPVSSPYKNLSFSTHIMKRYKITSKDKPNCSSSCWVSILWSQASSQPVRQLHTWWLDLYSDSPGHYRPRESVHWGRDSPAALGCRLRDPSLSCWSSLFKARFHHISVVVNCLIYDRPSDADYWCIEESSIATGMSITAHVGIPEVAEVTASTETKVTLSNTLT